MVAFMSVVRFKVRPEQTEAFVSTWSNGPPAPGRGSLRLIDTTCDNDGKRKCRGDFCDSRHGVSGRHLHGRNDVRRATKSARRAEHEAEVGQISV